MWEDKIETGRVLVGKAGMASSQNFTKRHALERTAASREMERVVVTDDKRGKNTLVTNGLK